FIDGDLVLRCELAEARLTRVVLVEPLAELVVFGAENPLNVSDLIRHPLSSFEVPSPEIVALRRPAFDPAKWRVCSRLRLQRGVGFHRLRLCTTIAPMQKVPWAPEGWLFLIPVLILTALA